LAPPHWRDVEHGEHCDCLALARAVGVPSSSIDYRYCRNVLQKHWRVRCNHGCGPHPPIETPRLPRVDIREPLQAALVANAPV